MKLYPHERKTTERPRYKLDYWPRRADDLDGDMRKYLEGRSLSYTMATTVAKWYPSREAMDTQPRIVMPARMSRRSGIYWQARAMGDGEPRYQSPPVCREDALIVFGNFMVPRHVAITEGPMDALAAYPYVDRVVALMGNSPSDQAWSHLRELCRLWRHLGMKRLTLIGDRDAADAPSRWVVALCDLAPHVVFPYEKDLAACSRVARKDLLL